MANIRVDVEYTIKNGSEVSFTAPCNCSDITGLKVYHPGGSKVFTFKDAHGNALTGLGNLFSKGAYVKAILDVTGGSAYLQNADTNAYLESHIQNKNNPHGVTAAQVGAMPLTIANSKYNANSLVDSSGWFWLGSGIPSGRASSIVIKGEEGLLYFAPYDGTSQPFYPIYHTGNKPTPTDIGARPNNSILLNGNENLNDIIEEGDYYYGWWTEAVANAPVNSAFHLRVRKVCEAEVSQTYTQFTGGDNTEYTRQSSNNKTVWSEWKPLFNTVDLLWENAYADSAFAGQTFWKDYSKYSMIIFVATLSTEFSNQRVTAVFPKGESMEICDVQNAFGNKWRRLINLKDDCIYISNCMDKTDAITNDHVIPYRIYGLRMGVGAL